MARLSFRCDDDLVRLVDAARGDVARELWLRKAILKAASVPSVEGVRLAAPTERPVRSSTQAKTGVGPRPKGGK